MKMSHLLAVIFATISTGAMAATSGSLILQGTVSTVLSISVAAAPSASTLDLATSKTDLSVATITEQSNSNTGYKISASSANNGNLKRTGGAEQVGYTLKYGGTAVSLAGSSATPVLAKTVATPAVANNTAAVTVSYVGTATAAMLAGTYSDTVTFTIATN